jgi:hypothetical protein
MYDFSIVFEAVRKPHAAAPIIYTSVYIDDVQFVNMPCNQMHELSITCSFKTKDLGNNVIEFTPCSWKNDGGWVNYGNQEIQDIGLGYNQSFGQLVSPALRSTNNETHCLLFDYSFYGQDLIMLSIFIKNKDSNQTDSLVCLKISSSYYWNPADVPVVTTFDFVIVFQAERRFPETLNNQMAIFVNKIAYITQPCTRRSLTDNTVLVKVITETHRNPPD